MLSCLRQSTAATIKLGPFVDAADGATAETALSISQADIRISKNGGGFAQSNNTAGASHDESGYYDVPLDTTDTSVLGRLCVSVNESGARPVSKDFMVMPANVWDSMFGSDKLQVDVAQFGDSNGTFSSGTPAVNVTQIEGSDATNQIRDAVVDDATRIDASKLNLLAVSGAGGVTLADGVSHGGSSANMVLDTIGLIAGLVSAEVTASALYVDTCEFLGPISAAHAGNDIRGIGSFTTTGKAELQQKAADALNAYDPPTKAELDAAAAAVTLKDGAHGGASATLALKTVTVTADANNTAVTIAGSGSGEGVRISGGATGDGMEVNGGATSGFGLGIFANSGGSIGMIVGTGGASECISLDVGGSPGIGVIDGSLAGSVNGGVASVAGNVGGNVVGSVGSVVGGINTGSGTIQTLDALATAQDAQHAATQASVAALPSAAANADAVWDEATSGHTNAGTFGEQVKTDVDAILADTGTDGVVVAAGSKTGYALAASHDVYHADINVAIDNLDTQDEYTVTWFKNGARVTADVASPFKLTVIDRSDNTALLDNVDLAELPTDTGILWKNEGTDRMEPGNAYVVIVSATIDSATRTFSKVVSRDADA